MLTRPIRNRVVVASIAILSAGATSANTCTSETPNTVDGVLQVRWLDLGDVNVREWLHWDILELALEKSEVPYDLDVSRHSKLPGRDAQQLKKYGVEGNLLMEGSTIPLENALHPVRIPITLGLYSYLQLWVRGDDVVKFSDLKTLDDLRGNTILQGKRWLAVPILEAEGFDVRVGTGENLPRMLAQGRADIFLFGAIARESFITLGAKDFGLVMLPNVSVRLKKAHYFTVDKCSKDLHDALYDGMSAAFEDGSLQELLRTHPKTRYGFDWIEKGDFKVIDIENPKLTEETINALDTYTVKE